MKRIIATLSIILAVAAFIGCQGEMTTTTTTPTVTVDTDNLLTVASVFDLMNMEMNKSYILTTDLDLDGEEWIPLGSYESPFLGIFDGNGHTISNMQITQQNDSYNGLFAHFAGTVKDLEIKDFTITYTARYLAYVGGLAGYLSGNVENVEVSGNIDISNTRSNTYVGLMAGVVTARITQTMTADQFVQNTVINARAEGTIDVQTENLLFVGGLFGKTYNTEVKGAFVDCDIIGSSQNYRVYAGGLTGHHYGGILVGFEEYVETTEIPIEDCFVVSTITIVSAGTKASIGGFIGYSNNSVLSDNIAFSTIDYTGKSLYISPFLGESWDCNIENAIAYATLGAISDSEVELEKSLGSFSGFMNAETTFTGYHYLIDTNLEIDLVSGSEVTLADLRNEAWYDDKLAWDDNLLTIAEIIGFISE